MRDSSPLPGQDPGQAQRSKVLAVTISNVIDLYPASKAAELMMDGIHRLGHWLIPLIGGPKLAVFLGELRDKAAEGKL